MSYKICGQGPVTVPGCDSDSCEAIVAQAKVELREEFQASQEAQSEELKQFVGDSVSESDQSIRDDFASSQETQTNELIQAITDAVENDVDYNNVSNKPAVNGVTLQGDKTLEELGIYEVTPEQAAAAEQAQEILEESAELLDRVSSFGRKQFDQTTVTEEPTSQITFDPPGYVYSSTDTYSVYVNGLRLTDDEYSREDNVITLTEPIADAGQKVEIVVLTYPVLPVAAEVMDARIGADGKTYPSLGDAIRDKANIDGYYEEMTVGDAEQLISTQFVEDSDPYFFRPTGGSADVGNREYVDKIVGGTVGWNQHAKTGYSKSEYSISFVSTDGKLTISGTPTVSALEVRLTNSGIAFPSGHKILYGGASAHFGIRLQGMYTATTVSRPCRIANANGSILSDAVISVTGLDTSANYNESFYPLIIDLTALFNPTIADYIYSLEQSQAGAGVAWFRRYFPEDYYPYDAGTLKSVQTSAHKTYDADGNVIGTYPLDSSLTLRGVPKLVDGKLAFDGDVYPPSGEVQRRYGIVDLSTFTWTERPAWHGWRTSDALSTAKRPSATQKANAISTNYKVETSAAIGLNTLYSIVIDTDGHLLVRMEDGKTASDIKGYLVYELATPTTETAEGYEQYQMCDPSGTEEFVTTGIVPVGHETRYPANLRDKLQHLPDLPSPLIDGAYMVMVSGSQMHLERFLIPDAPTEDGTYTLKATVSGGTPTYTWEVGE